METSLQSILIAYMLKHSPKVGGAIFNIGMCVQYIPPWLKTTLIPIYSMLMLYIC